MGMHEMYIHIPNEHSSDVIFVYLERNCSLYRDYGEYFSMWNEIIQR